jgi:glucose/mannose-6-phosphate isomerase
VVASIEEVQAEGDGELAQLLDLVLVGDFLSLHLAFNEGIDPGPVPTLTELKRLLADAS